MAEGVIQKPVTEADFSDFDINDIPEDLIQKIINIERQNDI